MIYTCISEPHARLHPDDGHPIRYGEHIDQPKAATTSPNRMPSSPPAAPSLPPDTTNTAVDHLLVCFTLYSDSIAARCLFPRLSLPSRLGQMILVQQLSQVHRRRQNMLEASRTRRMRPVELGLGSLKEPRNPSIWNSERDQSDKYDLYHRSNPTQLGRIVQPSKQPSRTANPAHQSQQPQRWLAPSDARQSTRPTRS